MAKRRQQKNRVQNVRVVDPLAGSDGLKVERQLSAIHSSSNHIQVLCSGFNDINVAATESLTTIGWSQITLFDDFVSMAAQFNTFRIRSIRFDIYDINPALVGAGLFSTVHDEYTQGTQPTYSFVQVVDGSDAMYVPPGTGKISLTWVGHSLNEKGYYTTAIGANSEDFGGLRFVIPGATPNGTKYRILTKAVVDFRGRR